MYRQENATIGQAPEAVSTAAGDIRAHVEQVLKNLATAKTTAKRVEGLVYGRKSTAEFARELAARKVDPFFPPVERIANRSMPVNRGNQLPPIRREPANPQQTPRRSFFESFNKSLNGHTVPGFAKEAAAPSEPIVMPVIEKGMTRIGSIAATPVPIEVKAFQSAVEVGLLKRYALIDAERKGNGNETSKTFAKELIERYNQNQLLPRGDVASQAPALAIESVERASVSPQANENPIARSGHEIPRAVSPQESSRSNPLHRLLSKGGRSLLASLVIVAGLGQLKSENTAAQPLSVLRTTLHTQDAPTFGSNLIFPPRIAVVQATETPVITQSVTTDRAIGGGVTVTPSVAPNTIDTLPQPAVQQFQPTSPDRLNQRTEMSQNHVAKGEKSQSRFGRIVQHMNRILHRNSSTIDQAPKSQFSHFLNEPLNVADGGSFEGVIEQSYSLLPGATKFPEQAGYFAQVVYLLAKAHNPRNADLGNINAGRLPKTIEGYVGKKMQII